MGKALRLVVSAAAEVGVLAFEAEGWNALFAPKGPPVAVIAKLNETLRAAVASEILRKRRSDLAALPAKGEEFAPIYVRALALREVEICRVLLGK